MVYTQDFPHSFKEALKVSASILSRSAHLVSRGVVETESEQIVIAAYRHATSKLMSRAELYSRISDPFPEAAGERVLVWSQARAEGKLLQHLIGFQVFLGHDYEVGPDVLVPRPETELLVQQLIDDLRRSKIDPKLGIEIGVGSGVISVELLSHFPALRMYASELTDEAMRIAKRNAERILGESPSGAGRLTLVKSPTGLSIWEAFEPYRFTERDGLADFLVSNPPYLASDDEVEEDVLAHEPKTALFALGDNPNFFYREIATKGDRLLRPGGHVFLEIPPERAGEIGHYFRLNHWDFEILPDLTRRLRILIARKQD